MIKIVVIAIVCGIIVLYLKNSGSELTMPALIASGVILISLSLGYIMQTFSFLSEIIDISGINKETYAILLKITAIGYVVEFGSGTLQDFGLNSLADKLSFIGKFIIISVSAPIFYAVINILKGLLT